MDPEKVYDVSDFQFCISFRAFFSIFSRFSFCHTARISGSQDELDDESVQGKHQHFDNFSMFSSE